MFKRRKFSIFLAVLLLFSMFALGRYYFFLFSGETANFAKRDALVLHGYNDEIIERLEKTQSTDDWQKILDSYKEIIVHIEDRDGNPIAVTSGKEWSMLDVKIQNPFTYGGEAYIIRSSVYSVRGYLTDSSYLFRFIILILLIVLTIIILLVTIIYAFMLRPVYRLYDNIELYESGQKPRRTQHRSQIGRLQNRFVEMTETIDKQQENQKRIIASISHDIKTPLTSIMGYAELLKKENLSEERKQRYLGTVYQKSVDIKGLIDDFDEYLSYNKESSLHKTVMPVKELMEKLIDGYEEELSQINVEFICNSITSDSVVDADIIKLRRVFGNIIGNATKHFNKDRRFIEVSTYDEEKYFVITVSDNGEGVDGEKLELIFEPLYTSDEGRQVAGLGLAICREIIESHGGIIYAGHSAYGGLTVTVKLKKH